MTMPAHAQTSAQSDARALRVLAVDGGQSTIRVQHSDADRSVDTEGLGRLEGDLVTTTAHAVIDAWRLAGHQHADRVVLGLTTAPPDADQAQAVCRLVGEATGADEVWLADDSVTAHYGALSGTPGVALVAGTGVACLALRPDGTARAFDGNGYLLGCLGSAFWIGQEAVRTVLRRHDGIGEPTQLEDAAQRRYGPLAVLREAILAERRPVNATAQFARDVLEVAADGDVVADRIVHAAAIELAATAAAGADWMGGDVVDIALGGKLLAPGTLLRRYVDAALATSDRAVAVRTADASGLAGALQLGVDNAADRYPGLITLWRTQAEGKP